MPDEDSLSREASEELAWHALSKEDATAALDVDPEHGLDEMDIKARRARFGANRLKQGIQRSLFRRLIRQFNNPFIYLLLIAGVVTGLLGEYLDSGVIFSVVGLIAIIGFIQEGRAERALESVREFLSHEAKVTRRGARQTVSAAKLVPGDIVHLVAGDRVPADIRLLVADNLQVQESALTGESIGVEKTTGPVEEKAETGDRKCLAHSGTVVTAGQAVGVVVRIGAATEIGRISGMLADLETLRTPLLRRLDAFSRTLTVAILALGAVTFAIGTLLWGRASGEMFLAAVSVAVAAIPEGLPAVMTVTLAIGVERMAKRHAIIRKLPAVETLGAVTTICADKTGTLTTNEMTVRSLRTATSRVEVEGVGYAPKGGFTIDGAQSDLQQREDVLELLRIGLLCNDARVMERDGGWRPDGDPMEAALIVLARKAGCDLRAEAEDHPRKDEIPFTSERQYMATLHQVRGGSHVVYVKGAPERLLEMCRQERHGDEVRDLDLGRWQGWADEIADGGQRVLAAASKDAGGTSELSEDGIERGLIFLGLFGLIDPARAEAVQSVATCHAAGIRVKMITGDHARTAAAIARELGLHNADRVLTGREIEEIAENDLSGPAQEVNVFARASPEHKLRLVKALQSRGQVVAMTGDGVNDAPALKRADVGIAMGRKGTEAAREASSMVLADDNFASIERAVEEGRVVYDNLRKSILFLLPTSLAQSFIVFLAIVFNFVLPVTPVQILWINLVTAATLGIAFAWEAAEGNLMARAPHRTDEPLFTGFVLWRTAFVGLLLLGGAGTLFFLEQQDPDSTVEVARTLAMNGLVMGQAFYLLNTRSRRAPAYTLSGLTGNRVVLIAIAAIITLQILLTYVPFLNTLFSTAPLAASDWMLCAAVGLVVFVLVEAEKMLLRRGVLPFVPHEDERPARLLRQGDDGSAEAGLKIRQPKAAGGGRDCKADGGPQAAGAARSAPLNKD